MADTTRAPAPPRPDAPRAAKCPGCGRTYCVCPRPPRVLTLRVATGAEVAAMIEAGVDAGDRVVLTDLPPDGLLLGGEAA